MWPTATWLRRLCNAHARSPRHFSRVYGSQIAAYSEQRYASPAPQRLAGARRGGETLDRLFKDGLSVRGSRRRAARAQRLTRQVGSGRRPDLSSPVYGLDCHLSLTVYGWNANTQFSPRIVSQSLPRDWPGLSRNEYMPCNPVYNRLLQLMQSKHLYSITCRAQGLLLNNEDSPDKTKSEDSPDKIKSILPSSEVV